MNNYKGSVTIPGGLRPLEGQKYALLSTDLIQADDNGTFLDVLLTDVQSSIEGLNELVENKVDKSTLEAYLLDMTENIYVLSEKIKEAVGQSLTLSVEGEVEDGEPNIENPAKNVLYLVKDGAVYVGWLYSTIEGEDQWVSLGNSSKSVDWSEVTIGDESITFTEAVGTVTSDMISKGGGSYTLNTEGKTVKEVLSSLFAEEKQPTYTAPTVSFAYTDSNSSYEVGTTITPAVSVKLTSEGSYSYGSFGGTATGVTLSSINIKNNEGEEYTSESSSFESFTVSDDTNYVIYCNASTSAATTYGKTNLGNKSSVRIPSKNFSSTKTIKGYRNYYYGSYADYLTTLSAAEVKAKSKTTSLSIATQTISSEIQTFFVAFPVSLGRKTVSLTNESANGPIAVNEPIVVSIGGVNDYSPVDYYVYIANGIIDKGTKVSIKIRPIR